MAAVVLVSSAASSCSRREPPAAERKTGAVAAPIDPTALLATLRARSGSPVGAAIAQSIDVAGGGLKPTFAASVAAGESRPGKVTLPAQATGAVHLEDSATAVAVDVTLQGALAVTGQVVDGFVVYPSSHTSGAHVLQHPVVAGTEDYLAFESKPSSPQISYALTPGTGAAALRLVANTLEVLDAGGAPRLRVAPPFIVGSDGTRTDATLAVSGCAVDTDPSAPWGRPVTAPGASTCTVTVSWPSSGVSYPAILDPRWTSTGSMGTARYEHTLTLLSTGKVLAVGGRSSTGSTTALATAELYDRTTGTWSATASLSSARRLHTATQLNTGSNSTTSGKVLVAGGINASTTVSTFQLYSASAGTWGTAANMNAGRHGHTATLLADGRVLAAGGLNGSTTLQTAAIYNPATGSGTWTATVGPIPPPGLKNHTATLIQTSNTQVNNKVLLVGGNDGTQSIAKVYLFDPTQSAFSTLASISGPRELHTAVAVPNASGKILVTGGKNGSTVLSSALMYDPGFSWGSWSSAGTMTSARVGHTMVGLPQSIVANGSVLVAGGSSTGSNTLSSSELFSDSTVWTATPSMPGTLQGHQAVVLSNNMVLVAGGLSASSTVSAATYLYDASFGLGCSTGSQCPTGQCVNGVCCDTACNGGCGACNLAGHLGTCTALSSGSVCRAAASGGCDVAETCNGSSLTCPSDGFASSSTTCRAAADECDLAETCPGNSTSCPGDAKKANGIACADDGNACTTDLCNGSSIACQHAAGNAGAVCRAAAGECDLAENCTGSSTTCPSDAKKTNGTACTDDGNACTTDTCNGSAVTCQHPAGNAGTVCRAVAGECDLTETCTGSSSTCPSDAKKTNGTACTDDGNVCTTDTCNGSAVTCQHPAGNAGTVCRAVAGTCDVAETCTGSSTTCPSDVLASASTTCRAAAGECDLTESCTGSSASCPSDAKKTNGTACTDDGNVCTTDTCNGSAVTCQHPAGNAGTVCRAVAGTCDVAETCTGSSTSCPADGFASASTTCRASAGVCDVAESCTGSSASCPTDALAASTTVCRASAGVCDFAESCTGSGASCPNDVFAAPSTVCRAAAGQCDVAETCTGSGASCPADALASNGTSCSDGNACTQTDTCQSGSCSGGNPVTCMAQDQCHVAGICNTSTGACSNPIASNGTSCSDGNACTQTDTCQAGSCSGGNPVTCVAQDQCHVAGTCNTSTGGCSNPPQVDGFACDDGDNCTASDMCEGGTCAAGTSSCNAPFALTSDQSFVFALDAISATLGSNQTDVAPGDQVGVTATLTNHGFNFGMSGTLHAENTSAEALVLGSVEVRLEYYSASQGQWIAVSSAGKNESGSSLPSSPASAYLNVFPLFSGSGVTFPLFTLPGTTISPGATAGFVFSLTGVFITPEAGLAAAIAARNNPVRLSFRVGTNPASTIVQNGIDLTSQFASLPAVPLAAGTVSARMDAGTPVTLSPPAQLTAEQTSATYTGTVVRPAAPTRSGFASDGAYLRVLADEVAKTPTISLSSSFVGAPSLVLPGAVPVVRTGVVNPPSIVSGQPVHYGLQFRNDGSGLASALSVAHVLNGDPLGTVSAPSQLAVGASASGDVNFTAPGNPPLSDEVVVTWNDRNGNVYGPLTYAPSSCPEETCDSFLVAHTLGEQLAQRHVTMTLAHAPASVVPGDLMTFTAEVSNAGATVAIGNGTLSLTNTGFSPVIVQGYQQTLEYFSPVDETWVPFARHAVDATGSVLPEPTLLPINLAISSPIAAAGVTYSQQPVVGTSVDPGSVARWPTYYGPPAVLIPPDILATLLDPSETAGLRSVIRFDVLEGPAPEPVMVDITPVLSGYTSEVPDLAAHLVFANVATLVPLSSVTSGPLAPGETRAFSANVPVPFTGPTTFTVAGAEAFAATPPNAVYASAYISLSLDIPILLAQKTGPAQSSAGLTETYSVTLNNVGTAAAESIGVTDTVDGASVAGAMITNPTIVAAGTTATATIAAPSPLDRPAGPMTDLATVSFKDRNGNVYPAQQATFTTDLGPAHPEGYLSILGDRDIPSLINTNRTITALALDPYGHPVSNVSVHFVVTGVNPQVVDRPTGADGKADLTYTSASIGKDKIVVSATITTTSITLAPFQIDWATATGTPCTGRTTPLDIMVVLDVSGSMALDLPEGVIRGKLEAARDATHRFIDNLTYPRDQIGVTTFYGLVTSFANLSTDTATAKDRITVGVDKGFECISGFGCFEAFFGDGVANALNVAIDELESPRHRPEATKVLVYVGDGGVFGADPTVAITRLHNAGIHAVSIGIGIGNDGPNQIGATSGEVARAIASTPNDYFYAPAAGDVDWVYNHLNQDVCRNRQPLVSAGGDQGAYGVRLPDTLRLNGAVHDDGPTGDSRFTTEWSVISGPGAVTFADATSAVTDALFALPGEYVLQLEATDGYLTVADRATIVVDPEPSLIGATLVVALGSASPLNIGATETLTATLTNGQSAPIPNFPVALTVAGVHPFVAAAVTNSMGVAQISYQGKRAGTDVLHATAFGATTQLNSSSVSLTWLETASGAPVVAQGWIASPAHLTSVTERVPIVLSSSVTLASGSLTYWPVETPSDVRVLAATTSGPPGATLATFDTTMLANGAYVVSLSGTSNTGAQKNSQVMVTVTGDYKPGRVVVEITDLSIPIAGLPITVGRRYDSLEKDKVGDFGYGWSLAIGHPRLEVDSAYGVTITLLDGRRSTFRFTPHYPQVAFIAFGFLLIPEYTPEPGVFGTLTQESCHLITFDPYPDFPKLSCFENLFEPDKLAYAPTEYTYTDPYGRQFVMAASGELKSIRDHVGNTLTFAANGILSSAGPSINFERDAQGRITAVNASELAPWDNPRVSYAYDAAGDLEAVTTPPASGQPVVVHHTYVSHRLLTTIDPRGNPARTSTYDADGRLATDTDALGHVTAYAYDLANRTTITTLPDTGQLTQVFDTRGLVLSATDPLGRTATHEYDANRNETKMINALGEETTATYDASGNQTSKTTAHGTTHTTYGALSNPTSFTNELGHLTTIEYDDRELPKRIADGIGTRAAFSSSEQGLPLTIEDVATARRVIRAGDRGLGPDRHRPPRSPIPVAADWRRRLPLPSLTRPVPRFPAPPNGGPAC